MRKYKEIKTTTIVENNMKVETDTKTYLHIIKTWDDLTTEEKEQEIEKNKESIYQLYQEDIYQDFLLNIEDIKNNEKYKHISFDTVYLDSNSQGGWIDSIKDFHISDYNIEILGETLEITDIDFHIARLIDHFEINVEDYYVETEKMEKIKKTKKYKDWYNKLEKEIAAWIEEINDICGFMIKEEYNMPWNLDDPEERYYLDNYFCDAEFETVELIEK